MLMLATGSNRRYSTKAQYPLGKSNRRDVIRVSPDLESALTVLVIFTIILVANLNVFVLTRTFNLFGSSTHKVDVSTKSEDNIFTKLAAEEYAKSAKANQAAQEAALEAAKVNQQTEQVRLERTRLEKNG